MQNDGKFSSHGNLGFAKPASLRKPDSPGFECGPLCYTGEQHIGGLVEVTSQHLIAAFRDPTCPVDLAGCDRTSWLNGRRMFKRIGREKILPKLRSGCDLKIGLDFA